jgi:protein-S-isoprenylcysteine O-methyltransferase Ste14
MHPIWYFVYASLIALLGVSYVTIRLFSTFQTKTKQRAGLTSKYFIYIALIEIIPLILVITGFIKMDALTHSINVTLPAVILSVFWILSLITIVSSKQKIIISPTFPKENRELITSFMFIGIALICSFPIINVFTLIMVANI